MAIEKRYERRLCLKCAAVHWVQVIGKDNDLCMGLDFVPPMRETAVSYTRHRNRHFDVREKVQKSPKTNFKTPKHTPAPEVVSDPARRCVAELSMPTPAGYASIKVFDDSTPDQFYFWYWTVGGKPKKISSADLGTGVPLDLEAFAAHFKVQDRANFIIHDRSLYNNLLKNARQQLSSI